MTTTVAITNHNLARFLPKAIESALCADQVIVLDDASTDESVALAESYGVEVVRNEFASGHCTWGRREAIQRATGDYIVHLDADDWLMPGWDSEPFVGDWVVRDLAICDEHNAIRDMWTYEGWPLRPDDAMAFVRERRSLPVSMKGAFRVAWLRDKRLSWYEWPSTSFAEDCRTCLEYLKYNPCIVYQPTYLTVYRMHEAQDSRNDERRALYLRDLDDYLKGAK